MSRRISTPSQMNFAQTVHADIPRSIFNRPSGNKTTFNCGYLVPVYWDEVLPGDTFDMSIDSLTRLTTPVFPTMDDLKLEFYAFNIPFRILWDGWEPLCGENKTGAWSPVNPPALVPVYEHAASGVDTTVSKKLGDYMTIPVGADLSKYPVSVLPFRAYASVFNDWFRDENLQAPIVINKGNTIDSSDYAYGPNSTLLKVNKFHDYFTSALPAPQKGDSPLIPIHLNELIPVITRSDKSHVDTNSGPIKFKLANDTSGKFNAGGKYNFGLVNSSDSSSMYANSVADLSSDARFGTYTDLIPINMYADPRNITQMNSTTISELRTAFQIQKLYEKDARGGTRYVEMLKAHFGVDAGDYRLQRPEFLGMTSTTVGIQSVPQTSSTDSTSPQGNLAAYSVTGSSGHLFKKSFVEHGLIMIFAVARQVKTYQQGINKFFSKRERFDFYYPTLSCISEQPIYNREIYSFGNDGNQVFGYQEAWADYRYKPNTVTGQMRSGVSNSYDTWHYADYYDAKPVLGSTWIQDNSDSNVDRTLAVSMATNDQLRCDIAFHCTATRPMPVYSIPGLVDHF